MNIFLKKFISTIKSGDLILDLGAGFGNQVEKFVERGAKVTVIDHRPNPEIKNILWHQDLVENFAKKTEGKFDAIFMQNICQFFDRDYCLAEMLPILKNHLKPGGIIVIKTFYDSPEPEFVEPIRSLYVLEDFRQAFNDFEIIYQDQYEEKQKDAQVKSRKFFFTEIIMKKQII